MHTMELQVAEMVKEVFAEANTVGPLPALHSLVVWQGQSSVQLVGGRWGLAENESGCVV